MDELRIDYSPKGFLKYFSLILSIYSLAFGLYLCILNALSKNYSIIFFCSLLLIILAVISILYFTVWRPKPIIIIDSNFINTNFPGFNSQTISWDEIKEINIGLSSIILILTNQKQVKIELGSLIYEDLKNIKSRIIEFCENKGVKFQNI